jgi:hypothetical protein
VGIFLLKTRLFFSRRCSLPSCRWLGSVCWLLFLVFALFFSFVLWLGGLGGVRVSFVCCFLCSGLLSVGWLLCRGSSWCLFCLWLGLGRFCPCRGLSRLVGGSSPFFFSDWRSLAEGIALLELSYRRVAIRRLLMSFPFLKHLFIARSQ